MKTEVKSPNLDFYYVEINNYSSFRFSDTSVAGAAAFPGISGDNLKQRGHFQSLIDSNPFLLIPFRPQHSACHQSWHSSHFIWRDWFFFFLHGQACSSSSLWTISESSSVNRAPPQQSTGSRKQGQLDSKLSKSHPDRDNHRYQHPESNYPTTPRIKI